MKQDSVRNALKTTLTASLACSIASPAYAHGEGSDHELEELATTTAVGRRAVQDNSRLTSSLLNIDTRELSNIGKTSLVDNLKHLPGVLTSGGGQAGTIKGIRVRGLRPEDTQVRVDGVRISRRLSNLDLFVGNLGLTGSSKVELLKGGQSALYGASANGGVLNISSKGATGDFNNRIQVEAGSFNSFSVNVEHSGTADKEGKLKYKAFSSFSTTDNDTFGDNSETAGFDNDSVNYSAGIRLDYAHNDRVNLGLTYRTLDITSETPQSSRIESTFILGTVGNQNSLSAISQKILISVEHSLALQTTTNLDSPGKTTSNTMTAALSASEQNMRITTLQPTASRTEEKITTQQSTFTTHMS